MIPTRRIARAALTAAAVALLAVGPATPAHAQPVAETATRAAVVTVVPGDTLSGIHNRNCGGWAWTSTWRANPWLANPNLIYPGQRITLGCSSSSTSSPPAAAVSGWANPLPGACLSGPGGQFGAARGTRSHQGQDISARSGTPVRATAGGVATRGWQAGGAGNYVTIRHAGGVWSHYMHLSSFAIANGQSVGAGQVIGYVGATGNATRIVNGVWRSFPHLHFEIRPYGSAWGTAVNPVTFLAARGVRLGC